MRLETERLLEECKRVGYKRISIGIVHRTLPQSVTFPFGAWGSVFAWPNKRINGWPAIWDITNKLGIGVGCGNSHQHQIDMNKVDMGVWYLNRNGRWTERKVFK